MVMFYDRVGKVHPQWRYGQLLALVRFAAASGRVAALPPAQSVERWLAAWGTELAERLVMYDACCECALKLASEDEAQSWLLLLLRECEGADAAELAKHKPRALAAVGAALRSRSQFQLDDLAQLAVVKQLAADAAHKSTAQLLDIFVSGSLADYRAFEKAQPAVLAGLGLDSALAARKMQLLAFVALAHAAGGEDIPFARVAEATEVTLDEVEELVLDAIAAELLEARMDEVRSIVRVGRCMHRTFGAAEWKRLHVELGQWRATIQELLEVVGTKAAAV
jgi:translation initiation factor 3 subunit M